MAEADSTRKPGPKFKDLSGERFEMLLVLRYAGMNKYNKALFLCRCDCGTEKVILGNHLPRIVSCGCWKKRMPTEQRSKPGRKKDGKRSPEYTAWAGAKDRCTREGNKRWADYGGRGIRMCQRWMDSFDCFLSDMGEKPSPLHSLERKDVNAGYSPENCEWAVLAVQANNKRRSIRLTFQGETLTLAQWSKRIGIKVPALYLRLYKGMPVEEALTKPLRVQTPLTDEERAKHKAARLAVREQVRSGKMPHVSTLKCVHCGKQAEHYHHFAGYERENRLLVKPICEACHLEI